MKFEIGALEHLGIQQKIVIYAVVSMPQLVIDDAQLYAPLPWTAKIREGNERNYMWRAVVEKNF